MLQQSILLDNKELLKGIFYSAVDGIIVINSRGEMLLINPAAASLFGYDESELLGRNINMLMPAPHSIRHDAYIHNYESTGKRKIIGIGREVQGMRKDGELFHIDLSVSEICVNGERIYTGVIHDISAQKASQESIRRINDQLQLKVEERTERLAEVVNKLLEVNSSLKKEIEERQAIEAALRKSEHDVMKALEKERELSELKSRFVSTASHEFRTPLSTILSSASLIERYTTEDQQNQRVKHIQRIKSSVNNLISILNNFLSISKLEEGKTENVACEFDFLELIQEILEELQVYTKQGQTIAHQHQGDCSVVCLNKPFIKNVVINLLSNAVKYSGESQKIDLETEIGQEQIRVKVRDYGIGIPKEEQPHLFERFFRAKNATNIQGTGLGLNIVKKYVDLMNGVIHFQSEVGEGTTFEVVFPKQPLKPS